MSSILIVSRSCSNVGGLERFVRSSALELNKRGHKIYGIFWGSNESVKYYKESKESVFIFEKILQISLEKLDLIKLKDFVAFIKEKGVKVAIVHSSGNEKIINVLNNFFRLVFFVHDHEYYCARKSKGFSFLQYNCTLPYRWWICGPCAFFSKNAPSSLVKILPYLRKASRIVVFSKHMKNHLTINKIPQCSIAVISPFVDSIFWKNSFSFIDQKKVEKKIINVVYVGQMLKGKGIDVLLHAVALLKKQEKKNEKKFYEFSFNLVGDGYQREKFEKLSKKLNIFERVFFHGYVTDPERFMKKADIVIVPSRWQEPFGLVGIEAMMLGKPVIAFDRGGIKEWLKDAKTGFLIERINAEDLVKAIEKLAIDGSLRLSMAKEAYESARKYYLPSIFIAKLEKFLRDIL